MSILAAKHRVWGSAWALAVAAGCSGVPEDASPLGDSGAAEHAVTARVSPETRLANCGQDPRVMAGLVSPDVCAGADIFFRETFEGNGRTCGSCHPVANNLTIDVPFIEALHASNDQDPLFVSEFNAELARLETADLRNAGAILENVDGFEEPTGKFVSRAVNHLFSLRTSILRDPGDGTSGAFIERTGWSGDGSPEDGTLRTFLANAVKQHFTKTLSRREDVDFRKPDPLELDLANAYQLNLGRLNELDLERVRIADADAEQGRSFFMDPMRGRCNVCHSNAGANFIDTRLNRNFDTFTRITSGNLGQGLTNGEFNGRYFTDGGFDAVTPIGGDGAAEPNAFGDGTFNVPPLIEAADTGPFFHNNARGPDIEDAVAFYAEGLFAVSPAAQALEQRFGQPMNVGADEAFKISRFLRVLNASFNASLAIQRLEAAATLIRQFRNDYTPIQHKLLELAIVEIDDALEVLRGALPPALNENAQNDLTASKREASLALGASNNESRARRVANALSRARSARSRFGTNITFQMGQSNLMF